MYRLARLKFYLVLLTNAHLLDRPRPVSLLSLPREVLCRSPISDQRTPQLSGF